VQGAWLEKTMPSHLKERVHARMEKTGESYEQALRHIRAQETRSPETVPDAEVPYTKSPARALSVADTAFSIAVVRADEALKPEGERLFEDPFASIFAAEGAHAAEATQRFLDLPFFRDGVRLRTRFIDDCVREGIASGLDQLVLLGAGFDSRGLRMPEIAARGVSVYEVDTPAQLERKRSALANAAVKLPACLTDVPFDFHTDDLESELASALEAKGFRRGAGAIFVWEGVIGYIDDAAIDRSLRLMASVGGARSRLVFTFAMSTFDPETAADRLRRHGFSECREFGGDDLWRMYLPGDPYPTAWVMKLGVASVS
jgi:methyltransferase (TIGR00027 family)